MDDPRFLDLSNIAQNPKGYALIGDPAWGAYIAWAVVEGVYEFHAGIVTEGRGPWAIDFSAAAIQYMFCASDCIELITRLPEGAVGSRALARKFGFRERWSCPETRYRGKTVPYDVVSLTLFDWLPSDDGLRGQVFAEMERQGMGKKAHVWYQRWALLSSTEQVH
jgi:hypothetical protein